MSFGNRSLSVQTNADDRNVEAREDVGRVFKAASTPNIAI